MGSFDFEQDPLNEVYPFMITANDRGHVQEMEVPVLSSISLH